MCIRAMKLVKGLKNMSYDEKLREISFYSAKLNTGKEETQTQMLSTIF